MVNISWYSVCIKRVRYCVYREDVCDHLQQHPTPLGLVHPLLMFLVHFIRVQRGRGSGVGFLFHGERKGFDPSELFGEFRDNHTTLGHLGYIEQ